MTALGGLNNLKFLSLNCTTRLPKDEDYPLSKHYLPPLLAFNHLHSLCITGIPCRPTSFLGNIFKTITRCRGIRILSLTGTTDNRVSNDSSSNSNNNGLTVELRAQKYAYPFFDWELYRTSKCYEIPFIQRQESGLPERQNPIRRSSYKNLIPLTHLSLTNFALDGKIINWEVDPQTLTHLTLINCIPAEIFTIDEEILSHLQCLTMNCFFYEILKAFPYFYHARQQKLLNHDSNGNKVLSEGSAKRIVQFSPRSTSLLPIESLQKLRFCTDGTKKLNLLDCVYEDADPDIRWAIEKMLTNLSMLPRQAPSQCILTTLRLPASWLFSRADIHRLLGMSDRQAGSQALWHIRNLSLALESSQYTWNAFLDYLPNLSQLTAIHVLSGGGVGLPWYENRTRTERFWIDDASDILQSYFKMGKRECRLKYVAVKSAVWAVERGGSGEEIVCGLRLRRCSWEEVEMNCHWGYGTAELMKGKTF